MIINRMKIVIIVVLLICIKSKLYQVVSLTRHGARYHVNDFGDGNDTKSMWGQLTAPGMRQHQRLGQLFRKQYIDNLKFLSPTYNSSQMEVYSTPVNRTMLSIQSQLYGLYPPGTGPRLTPVNRSYHLPPYSNKSDVEQRNFAFSHGFQPIKVKQKQTVMLSDCPNYGKYSNINFQTYAQTVAEMNMTYYPFFKRLSPMFNYSMSTVSFYTMLRVWDAINVDNYLGRPLPSGLTADDQKNVLHLANWYFMLAQLNNISIMYNSGKLQKIISAFDMRTKLPKSYALKWSFLSGHDTDIIAMYIGLNLSSFQCIQQKYRKGQTSALNCEDGGNIFAANLIFELHSEDQKTFYVKLRSNGKYIKLCGKNQIQCQYNEWKNQVKKNIVSNVSQLCGKKIQDIQQEYFQMKPLILQI